MMPISQYNFDQVSEVNMEHQRKLGIYPSDFHTVF